LTIEFITSCFVGGVAGFKTRGVAIFAAVVAAGRRDEDGVREDVVAAKVVPTKSRYITTNSCIVEGIFGEGPQEKELLSFEQPGPKYYKIYRMEKKIDGNVNVRCTTSGKSLSCGSIASYRIIGGCGFNWYVK